MVQKPVNRFEYFFFFLLKCLLSSLVSILVHITLFLIFPGEREARLDNSVFTSYFTITRLTVFQYDMNLWQIACVCINEKRNRFTLLNLFSFVAARNGVFI